ncbi:MAG: LPS export ABC transporter ATP-binding protein [Pseudomonadales bacterium]|jgi:lipopolysaccharide export system ATP-binding protein|nr:LPS export ABC transporter ATP-binding protein [Pseudomonadales bacterium]
MRLTVSSLRKSYRSTAVVQDVSLSVESGQIVGLLGPNGAGKTTTFYMIVGLVKPDAGSILLGDTDLTHLPMHARARLGIGYLPQEASVFRKLSVEDNVMAILETRKHLDRAARRERCDALLEEFSLSDRRQRMGASLSGGERRRTEIARALAMEPAFILLDEPFAGVDPISVAEIKGIVRHLKGRNIGVLITDHNVRETLDICDDAYIVASGNIIASGKPSDVLADTRVRQVYLGEGFRL